MEDTLITFDTAKLAKEKGFGWNIVNRLYTVYEHGKLEFIENINRNVAHPDFEKIYYPAPTQSLLQKWLREVHNIHIFPVGSPKYSPCIVLNGTNYWRQDDELSYEEALEKGLYEALKLIIV